LFVAHLDHGLRGDVSSADAEWLRSLCQRLGVPLEIGESDVESIAHCQGDGLEAAARSARYEFLRQTAERLGARFIATAHTADDQIETVLHHILRGTGIDGLRGIPTVRPISPSVTLVRPLLDVRRRDVVEYLTDIDQDFRCDESNSDLRWTRNRLRHKLLPAIREYYNGDIDTALLRLASQAAETQGLIGGIASKLASKCVVIEFVREQPGEQRQAMRFRINCKQLNGQSPVIVREVCKAAWQESHWPRQAMGYKEWQQLAALVDGDAGASPFNLPGNVRAWREGGELFVERFGLP
jgi:tRNA(Ile)-lysidine synthase